MDEELDTVYLGHETWDELSSVGDQRLARFNRKPLALQPVLQCLGPRENADSTSFLQTIPRFLSNNPVFLGAAFLRDHGGGNPEVPDLDSSLSVNVLLILLRMLEVKEIRCSANMVVIEM